MSIARKMLILGSLLLLLAGCGGGGDNVGNLTLAVTPADNGDGTYAVGAVATYTNPTHSDLVNTEITFSTSIAIPGSGLPVTLKTPTNGIIGWNFNVPKQNTAYSFYVIARTGSLEDSKIVKIPALGALTPSPTTLTFTSSQPSPSTQTITVSGGTQPYSTGSSNTALATASVSGNTVTVTRQSNATGTVIITISDSAVQQASTSVSVTLH